MINYLSAAKVLEELMLELMQGEAEIPGHVTGDLKSGRSFASLYLRQPDDEIAMKTSMALQNVEMNLLSLTEELSGRETAEAWQRRIIEAYQREPESRGEQEAAGKFVQGVPKDKYWIRLRKDYIEAAGSVSLEAFRLAAAEQEDGYLLIYGAKEDVTAYLGVIREKTREAVMKK